MQLLISLEEISNLKSRDLVPLKCEQCGDTFNLKKHRLQDKIKTNTKRLFCSKRCADLGKITSIETNCLYCNKQITLQRRLYIKTKNHFCNNSCKMIYSNIHIKEYRGFNRSKLERYIQTELMKFIDINCEFNTRTVIEGYELDLYFPNKKLAIEFNGPLHYKSIHGKELLNKIVQRDLYKMNYCQNNKIKLVIFDVSRDRDFNTKIGEQYFTKIQEILRECGENE